LPDARVAALGSEGTPMARELMRAAAIVAFACKLLSGSPYASQRRFSRRLAGSVNVRDPAIERGNQLPQLLDELTSRGRRHRLRGAPYRSVCDRNTFHTSPHFVHRQ
jgi:hypothetical protein